MPEKPTGIAREQWARIVAQAWADETYKSRLLAEPKVVLAEQGVNVPEEMTVEVHECTDSTTHFVLPEGPVELGDEDAAIQAVINKALADASFKQRLLADPHASIKEAGIDSPEGMQIKVWENTPNRRHLVLDRAPDSSELSDAELLEIVGGRRRRSRDKANIDDLHF